jgi:hypothetical protein
VCNGAIGFPLLIQRDLHLFGGGDLGGHVGRLGFDLVQRRNQRHLCGETTNVRDTWEERSCNVERTFVQRGKNVRATWEERS